MAVASSDRRHQNKNVMSLWRDIIYEMVVRERARESRRLPGNEMSARKSLK